MTKRQPYLWPSEWRVLMEHLKREKRALPPPRADGACPFLDASGKRCSVYEARPFGCRTFFLRAHHRAFEDSSR
ncbi:MAG: YkgJ family cysteine cluster protein [Anaeromyxobacter sp.]